MCIAITTALVVLSTKVNPNNIRDHPCARFVAPKDMGDGFAKLRASVTFRYEHTFDFFLLGGLLVSTGDAIVEINNDIIRILSATVHDVSWHGLVIRRWKIGVIVAAGTGC